MAVCVTLPMMSYADKKKNAAAPVEEEEPAIVTEDCVMYTSLFHESAKNKQYADALDPWMNVYKTCPSYSKNVYIDGDKIVEWKISQCQVGSAEYNEWRKLLLTLHDKRIKYSARRVLTTALSIRKMLPRRPLIRGLRNR